MGSELIISEEVRYEENFDEKSLLRDGYDGYQVAQIPLSQGKRSFEYLKEQLSVGKFAHFPRDSHYTIISFSKDTSKVYIAWYTPLTKEERKKLLPYCQCLNCLGQNSIFSFAYWFPITAEVGHLADEGFESPRVISETREKYYSSF